MHGKGSYDYLANIPIESSAGTCGAVAKTMITSKLRSSVREVILRMRRPLGLYDACSSRGAH